MPVIKVYPGCTEFREFPTRDGKGYENRICGRPIYLNGVCDQCWRCNEQLRGDYSLAQSNAAVECLGIDDRYIEMTMADIYNELSKLLSDGLA